MGVVYEGFDPDIERRVAIKTLIFNTHVDKTLVDEFRGRFKIEAKASARCMHPNIVTILEYGDEGGMPFIVMEYIDGQTLEDIIKLPAPIRFNRAIKIFSQLLKGLHFAHQSGVIHRDIKPSNIMILNNDAVKITDFGIARMPTASGLTQVGYTVGTPHYMAPEQEANSQVDGRADLFSLTVILMELLDKIPVTQSVSHALLSPHGIYITPRVNMTQMIPLPFLPLIQKGLALRANNRFASAAEYAEALKSAVTELQKLTDRSQTNTAAQIATVKMPSPSPSRQSSDQEYEQQIKEMEAMLVESIGPDARSLINIYRNEVNSVSELAQKLSQEIFSEEGREFFLKAWKSDDQITRIPKINTSRIQTKIQPVETKNKIKETPAPVYDAGTPKENEESALVQTLLTDQVKLRQVEDLYSQYVGSKAEYLLYDGILKSRDFNELSEKLQESIPGLLQKTDFKIRLRKIAH